MNFEKEILKLRRQVFRTRVGGVVALAGFALGIHHLGNKHHETFQEFYDTHKTPREPWKLPWCKPGWPHTIPWNIKGWGQKDVDVGGDTGVDAGMDKKESTE